MPLNIITRALALRTPFTSHQPEVQLPSSVLPVVLYTDLIRIPAIRIVRRIGHGSYGIVFQAEEALDCARPPSCSNRSPRTLAVKLVCEREPTSCEMTRFEESVLKDSKASPRTSGCREAMLHRRVGRHPHILPLLHHFHVSPACTYLVMEYADRGTLFECAIELDGVQRRDFFLDICAAVAHCHSRGIHHRDIKPGNCLVGNDPATGQLKVWLADFGLASSDAEVVRPGAGTRSYQPPEGLHHSTTEESYAYSPRAHDVWSLSVMLFTLATVDLDRKAMYLPWRRASGACRHWASFSQQNEATRLKQLTESFGVQSMIAGVLVQVWRRDPGERMRLRGMVERINGVSAFARNSDLGSGVVESEGAKLGLRQVDKEVREMVQKRQIQ